MSDFNHRVAKQMGGRQGINKFGQPGQDSVYVVPMLNQISTAFMLQEQSLVANIVAPSVKVTTQSGKYLNYPRGFFFRDDMAIRGDGHESAGGGFAVDNTPTYYADVWAWHTDIGPQVRANALAVDVDKQSTLICTNKALIRREKLFLSKFFTTGVWTTNIVGVSSGSGGTNAAGTLTWTDATALPIKQIKLQLKAAKALTGYRLNVAVFSSDLWDIFCEHPNVLSRIWNGQTGGNMAPAEITKQMVAAWLGIDKVLVADGVATTSNEGQNDTLGFMSAQGQLLLLYVPPEPGILVPSALYAFDWVADGLVGTFGNAVSRWYNQDRKATRYEIEMATDMHLVSADLGVMMSGYNT